MKQEPTGINKPRLYYIGDLPPTHTDGITTSFAINLDVLKEQYSVSKISEGVVLGQDVISVFVKNVSLIARTFASFIRRSPDVVYINYPLSFFGSVRTLSIVLLSKTFSAKTYFHLHRGDMESAYLIRPWNRTIANILISMSEKLIVLSESQKQQLSQRFDDYKIEVLPNTISTETKETRETKTNFNFLFLSNYLETKGIIDLLEVFKRVSVDDKRLNLVCHGAFPKSRKEKQIRAYSSERITINGPVYNEEKIDALTSTSCLILPSWSEGQPLVILEAMSLGIPVIATSVGEIPKMLGSNYPYVFEPHDRSGLYKVILKFVKNGQDHNHELGRKLRARYYQHYSIEKHAQRLLDIFGN